MEFHQGMRVGTSAQPCTRPVVPGEMEGAVAAALLGAGYLAVASYGLPALLARAGVEGLEAGHTVGALLPQDVLLAKERLFAMVAVKALHGDTQPFNDLPNRREHTCYSDRPPGMPCAEPLAVLRPSGSPLANRWFPSLVSNSALK